MLEELLSVRLELCNDVVVVGGLLLLLEKGLLLNKVGCRLRGCLLAHSVRRLEQTLPPHILAWVVVMTVVRICADHIRKIPDELVIKLS